MCGLAIIAIGERNRGRIPYTKLREFSAELLKQLQPRGDDASGIAVLNNPGSGSVVFKKPLTPNRLSVRPKFKETLEKIGPETNFIMLHARAATQGDTRNNFNNHPIIIPGCLGVHNGTLYNHDKLFKAFDAEFPQTGTVDSEVIFRLYKHYADNGRLPEEALKETSRHLSGAFTGGLVDWKHPKRIILFKHNRELSLISIPHYDMLISVSEARFYAEAAKRVGIQAKNKVEYVQNRRGFVIDLNTSGHIVDEISEFSLPVVDYTENSYLRRSWFRQLYT